MLDPRLRQPLIDLLAELVRIPSRSNAEGGEEGAVQALIAARMRDAGARVRTFDVDDISGARQHPLFHGPNRNYRNRPTVVGEVGLAAPRDVPTLMVIAHSDTVPLFEPDKWDADPFTPVITDRSMTGLGASDDKWGVACMLNIIRLVADHPALKRKRVRFCSTIDEESGVGNGLLLLMLAGVTADAAIYLDGGMNRVCIGNCGGSNFYLRPCDEQAHQSLDDDTAALAAMAARMSRERRPMFDRLPYFNDNPMRDQSVGHAVRTDARGRHHMVFFYTLPGEDRAGFCAELERAVRAALGGRVGRYETSYREPWFEPSCAAPDDAWTRLMADAVGRAIGGPAVVSTISKQDAFVLRNHANMPIVSYGVRAHAASRMNHQPNETIALDEVWTGLVAGHEMVKAWLERD